MLLGLAAVPVHSMITARKKKHTLFSSAIKLSLRTGPSPRSRKRMRAYLVRSVSWFDATATPEVSQLSEQCDIALNEQDFDHRSVIIDYSHLDRVE